MTSTSLSEDVRVGIYVRHSTDDDNQPYSIDAQDTRLDAYIDSQPGWRRVKRFADDASSGATTERPGLQQALAAAHAGLIDVLLVYRVDRFSRNLRDMVTLLDDLDQAGVSFRSATEPFDTSTPMGRMLVQMLGIFAQFERDTIIDRVIAGMERKAAKGKWKGERPPTATPAPRRNRSSSPIFRVPQPPQMTGPEHTPRASTSKKPQVKAPKEAVRTMTQWVGRYGVSLRGRCRVGAQDISNRSFSGLP
jgi:DNA invertase Pin-like site-specific DNA recombinase